ncbi:hypothetical protein Tco_1254314 [Tanacetum coccineum]
MMVKIDGNLNYFRRRTTQEKHTREISSINKFSSSLVDQKHSVFRDISGNKQVSPTPWTIVSVSNDDENTGGGGTLQSRGLTKLDKFISQFSLADPIELLGCLNNRSQLKYVVGICRIVICMAMLSLVLDCFKTLVPF